MPQDEVLGAHGELLDVAGLCVELRSELVRCHIVILLNVKVVMEKELVDRSGLLPSSFLRLVVVDEVVPQRVLLAHRVVVPHASVNTDYGLPLFLLALVLRHRISIVVVITTAILLLEKVVWTRLPWLLVAGKRYACLVPVNKLASLLLTDQFLS